MTSMLKTLAAKHRTTVTKMARTYKAVIETRTDRAPASRPAASEQAGNRWSPGSVASRYNGRRRRSWPTANPSRPPSTATVRSWYTGFGRATANSASNEPMCRCTRFRSLAELARPGQPQPAWAQLMAQRQRKTLVVCPPCHDTIHARRAAMIGNDHVRFGPEAAGKDPGTPHGHLASGLPVPRIGRRSTVPAAGPRPIAGRAAAPADHRGGWVAVR
jgi:hypothetical protein